MSKHIGALKLLSWLGIIEGYSYLFLLFIAMPLKYIFKFGVFVKFGGWLHGVLFVTLACVIVYVWWLRKWPLLRAILAGLATLLPFGTFLFDKKLKSEIKLLSKTN